MRGRTCSPALRIAAVLLLLAAPAACTPGAGGDAAPAADPPVHLKLWKGGIALETSTERPVSAYLWFYEWNLFDAFEKGEETHGKVGWDWRLSPDGRTAETSSEGLALTATVTEGGADLLLTVTNLTGHDWPEIAAMIPCLSPGLEGEREEIFVDAGRDRTWFLGGEGLEKLQAREIHFNRACGTALDEWEREGEDGHFAFAGKWPVSERQADRGLMVRESTKGKWVLGIGWEDFVSAQGHNPLQCMHLSVKVGPLARGEIRTVRGKMYLFRGSKDDCLARFRRDFPAAG